MATYTCPSCGCEELERIFIKPTPFATHSHRGGDSFQRIEYHHIFLPRPELEAASGAIDLYICPRCGTIKGVVHERETEA